MPRLVAAVLVIALLSLSTSTARQHVHAYGGHDHPDHHHGPAAHAHAGGGHTHGSGAGKAARTLDACGPGAHAVPVVFTYSEPEPHHGLVPAFTEAPAVVFALVPSRAVLPADARAHSPPRVTDAPLRAPPLPNPA